MSNTSKKLTINSALKWGDIMKEIDGDFSIVRSQNEAANRKWIVP